MTHIRDASVRAFVPADMDSVISFDQAVFSDDAWSPEVISTVVAHPSVQSFVAELEIDGAIEFAGYCALHLPGRVGSVVTIGVAPEFRGKGIGRLMMNLMIDASLRAGAAKLKLRVRPGNLSAIGLYASLGFRAVGRVDNYYEADGGEAQMMELSLPPS